VYQTIRLDHSERVSTITINRPPLNTVSPRALAELLEAFGELERRDETRCVVLTGSGNRAFCAGADLGEKPKGEGDPSTAFREAGRALVDRIEGFPKPVIAAIRGWCIGGGFAIAESCDVRIASDTAKFRTGDAYLGIVPSWGMSLVRLCHYIGRNRALDMLILGEDIGAAEAKDLGLVSRVIADDKFDTEIAAIAARVATGAPLVFRSIKEAILSQYAEGVQAAKHLETYWSEKTQGSHDYNEGIAAFKAKRKPRFEGR
jgi:enoyl-CoA hydratase/carnithine racemase